MYPHHLLSLQLDSDGDHRLYPQISLFQLMMILPPSRRPISRLKSRFCITSALTSAIATSTRYLLNTSLSLLYMYEDTPKRTVTLGSSNSLSFDIDLLTMVC